jgi:hypothetical protein
MHHPSRHGDPRAPGYRPLLPAPRLSADIGPDLAEAAERRMLAPARKRGYELRLVGATVLPQRQVIARSQSGTWLFVDHVDDPTAHQYKGRIPIPAGEYARLTELDRAGVRPDLVWLGHELPPTWREGDPIPVPTPIHLRRRDERLSRGMQLATGLMLRAVGATLAAPLVMAGAIAEAGAAAVAEAGAGLDPVVLGGVRHSQAPIVQWALLAQWEWE